MYVYFLHSSQQKTNRVKTTVCKEMPGTEAINLNELNLSAKEKDIVLNENYEEMPIIDNVQLIFGTIKQLISLKNCHSSNETLNKLSEEFILRYGFLDKNQKQIVLVKVATTYYIKLEDLKKKVSSIDGPESLINAESDLRKILDPSYNWIFERLSKIPEHGLVILEELLRDLLNLFATIPILSNYQKTALRVMKDHVSNFAKITAKQEKEKEEKKKKEETSQPCKT